MKAILIGASVVALVAARASMAQSGAVPPSGPDAPAASAKRERTDHPAAAALESKGGTTPAATTPEAAPGAAPAANASANGATVAATVPAPVPGKLNLHIQGRVTTLSGDPVQSADVQVDIGVGSNPVRSLETNLQGGFETDYVLDPVLVRNRSLSVTAIKEGLEEGFERTDFAALGTAQRGRRPGAPSGKKNGSIYGTTTFKARLATPISTGLRHTYSPSA